MLFRLQKKYIRIPLSVKYYRTKFDDVISSGFWVIPKITSTNLCKPTQDIINCSTFIRLFESGKCEMEAKKLQKFEYLENKKSFLDEVKNVFIVFEGLYLLMRNYKTADTSFKLYIKNTVTSYLSYLHQCDPLWASLKNSPVKYTLYYLIASFNW